MASDAAGPNFDMPPLDVSGETEKGSSAAGKAFDTKSMMRESLAWIIWTVLADLLIFRAWGLAGPAVFLALVPLIFGIGCRPAGRWRLVLFCSLCCLIASLRLVWSGGPLVVFVGMMLIPALAMAVSGEIPLVLETIALGIRSPFDGLARLIERQARPRDVGRDGVCSDSVATSPSLALSFGLPVVAAIAFGGIFVFANPDLYTWVMAYIDQLQSRLWDFLSGVSFWELPFCVAALFVGIGLLRPLQPLVKFGPRDEPARMLGVTGEPALLYPAFRNTLLTVIVLFAAYLCFEFATLWRREFPDGFYYAGYAHEGAAWLTFALALATGTMSLIFSGRMLEDSRLGRLKGLAWIWSAENFLLAIAVYNRLLIYVGYNGMTRMRWVGFFGITLVVVGVIIVLVKIAKGRSFWWLLRAQLVAFALTVALYSVFPVDYVAHRYNASRINTGYLHPSVMIAVKPIDDEGVFPLLQLVDVGDTKIREGVRAILAERQSQIEDDSAQSSWHWTRYQASTDMLYRELAKNQAVWANYLRAPETRARAIAEFREYAMQWY